MTAMTTKEPTRGKVIVSGILFWYPLAGVTYQFLHYLIGLRKLGFDVYYIEDSGRWVYDPVARSITGDAEPNVTRVAKTLDAHGFAGKWAFRGAYPNGPCYGMRESEIFAHYREADALLNVTGAQEIREEQSWIKKRVYVESDPFSAQVKLFNGDAKVRALLDAHHAFFSFGENLGQPDSDVPLDRTWLPTRQPVATELWSAPAVSANATNATAYNTITTWHNDGKSVEYRGEVYHWTKDREFVRFLDVPQRRAALQFELATDADAKARALLEKHGFVVGEGVSVSASVDSYRNYIRGARAEFTVARDQYVRPRTGWFSDRSACYLASGRPVITQETAFSKYIPTGRGLFAFETLDDVLGAIDAIETDYAAHSRAALEIAREYFEAERVLASLMERIGL
jgi:hypothetical protein